MTRMGADNKPTIYVNLHLASFAPLRELYVSRKGAKPAKRQECLLVFGCAYAAL